MTKDFPEQRKPNAPSSGYAAEGELLDADQPILESAGGESRRDPDDREPASLADDDALYMDVATQPMSEITAGNDASGGHETADGLADLEESVRQQTEDRATGDDRDYIA
ncbi:hypothetical protein ASG43_18485 [Aureimonas sp. Leaf454]|uniref:hypothetical protein n=1 Tax=Aureimonas sp. Leaf454 TaxID=1736381 RepID=UPI0007006199|nr:hypothetical protein [Aureimonas sp. Leaf454]KQT53214.1 hypothetical protein ASG43_18485 [Aureimonas sp. Leaf454]